MKALRLCLPVILALGLLLSICAPTFAAEEGTCGPDATWRFEGGTLTISGTGPVTEIWWYELHNNILKVVVEPGIISLPDNAFQDCIFLTDVTLPEGLVKLGECAFMSCKSLGTVQLPSTLTDIGQWAFRSSGLTGITIPGSVRHIETSVFDNCEKLMRVTLEEGVTSIGVSAFYDCKRLTDVSLPNSLDTIENNAFENCTALNSIVLPENLTVIAAYAFRGCTSLENVALSPKTTAIEDEAFSDCPALRSIELPATVQRVYGLPNTLQEIHISDLAAWCQVSHSSYNPYLEHAGLYLNGELITDLVIPEGCKTISEHAFRGYRQLKSVTIPEGVTGIGWCAFYGCGNLERVTLPSSMESIGPAAFNECQNLTQITFLGTLEDLSSIQIGEHNDTLLNASWHLETMNTFQLFTDPMALSMLISCLISGGIFIACLVIFIRQKLNPFG